MKRICSKCKERKQFRMRTGGKSVQAYCIDCTREYHRQNYWKHRKEHNIRRYKNTKAKRRELLEWIHKLKNKPCADCSGSFHPVAMGFDHLRDKSFDVSHMVSGAFSKKRILIEIAKCELVCANCHAIRTFNRRNRV